ncbi:MAG: adenylate/guanylate cyclase domain-containing protein [Verrucomicrobiae bacterium]|nr:adenylate/guanylate cyclase domain-containing protein [Verrucomicrobiae bacterium]
MRRYLFVSLCIGFIVSVAVLTLVHLGIFGSLDGALGQLYRAAGFTPAVTGASVSAGGGHQMEVSIILAAAFAAAWCVIDIPHVGQKMLVFLTLIVVLLALSPTLALYGVVFAPFSSVCAASLATAAGFAYSGTEHGMRKRLLLDLLGARVSQETFRKLMDSREPVRFNGSNRAVSVLTCRVFNHPELREKMEPSELVAMGNLFLRNTADFLLSKGGYLDESSPDMVRVFFGMVRPADDHAIEASRAALELRTRLRNLNDECETRWFRKLDYGIAISSGPMTVGIYGSKRHYYFSGVGSDTDFSRRLAQANARYGSDILVSAPTYQLVKETTAVRPMEMLYDPERNLMTEVYQLLALIEDFNEEDKARRDAYWQGVILYRSGKFEDALAQFSVAEVVGKEGGPVRFFIERCQAGLAGESVDKAENRHELTDQGHARLLNMM